MNKTAPVIYLSNNVFYPETVIPLSVNDLILKKLLINCYENNLNVVLYNPHLSLKGVGTLGKIIFIEQINHENTTVMVEGLYRVKLLSMKSDYPFPQYNISDYNDQEDKIPLFIDPMVQRLQKILSSWLRRHISSSVECDQFMQAINTPLKLINNFCLLVIKDTELKQIFLEKTSLVERICLMNALITEDHAEIERVEICEAVKNFEQLEIKDIKHAS